MSNSNHRRTPKQSKAFAKDPAQRANKFVRASIRDRDDKRISQLDRRALRAAH